MARTPVALSLFRCGALGGTCDVDTPAILVKHSDMTEDNTAVMGPRPLGKSAVAFQRVAQGIKRVDYKSYLRPSEKAGYIKTKLIYISC